MRKSITILLLCSIGCSATPRETVVVETYRPAFRQLPPEPVYGRMSWSQLPQPIKPRVRENAPILMPTIIFTMAHATFGDAVQTLAQTIGYGWEVSPELEKKHIAINVEGPIDQIAKELGRQGGGTVYLDHENRIVRAVVVGGGENEILPQAKLN